MALLRLRFPWGFLFTTSGYAAMAAVATWYLSTDLHGHLWLRCALHAGGGALLGAVAWRLSERMTDWVNLHTSPLLRLGLPGAAAAVLAACATGPFCELAVGTGMLWPEAACALLFFAVGLAPMVAGVSLLAGLETMLAARRGGGGTAQALRPIWRHLAVGAVLGGASAYAAVELQPQIEHAMVALAPDRARTSEWLAAEQRLFVSVHALWNCEVLVVPFAAGTPSVDRPARSLITRYVAAELAARSGKCVADPTLVARALGSRRRAVAEADVEALADAMNARWVVRGSITRDEEQPKLTLALRLDQRSGPKQWGRGAQTQWGPLEFSDELPPEAAFASVARQVAEGLGLELEAGADAAPSAHPAGAIALPTTPAELTAAAESPLASARALQLLAALHHPSDVDGEHLWERSLVALRGLPAEDQNARVLRARAALHLYRRPYALSLLQGLADPEAHALMAVGNGNLVTAEPLARAVKDPAGALTLQLELESLRSAYGKTAGLAERRQALLDSHPGYAALLYAAISLSESDPGPALTLIGKQLDAEGMELRLGPMQALAVRMGLPLGGQPADLAAAIERGRKAAWRSRATVWRSQPAYDRPAPWDAADALYAAARGAVTAAARNRAASAEHAATLMSEVLSLGAPYAGYPPLAGSVAATLQADAGAAGSLQEARARRLPREVLVWEGGESDTERTLRSRIAAGLPAPESDEPPRPWRASTDATATQLARVQTYSQDAFEPLDRAIGALEGTGLGDQALRLREEARLRFIGSPAREHFLVRRAEESGDLGAYAAVLMERVREQPTDWSAYVTLARVYLSARQPAYAQQVLLAFPREEAEAGAADAQRAHEGGMLLLGAGEVELARPLLQRAAAGADSEAKLWSQIALARLDGNWGGARTHALQLHESYQAAGALARAASVSFLLGDGEAGWRAFYESAKRFEDFGPWSAAINAHRIERTRAADVEAFAERWKSLSGERATETRLRGYLLFNVLLVDRAPPPELVAELAKLAEKRQDPQLEALITGYAAFKHGEHMVAAKKLMPHYQPGGRQPAAYLLPYLVVSLSRTERAGEAQTLVDAARRQDPRGFPTLLSAAYLAGGAGQADQALDLLWQAFIALPPPDQQIVPAGFQLLEVCEQLYGLSRDDRYRGLLVDLARRQQHGWPVSWAYSFDARYSPRSEESETALGVALFLDPDSERLRDSGEERRKRAVARFPAGNPFQRG